MKNLGYIFIICSLFLSCDNSDLTKEEIELVEFNNFLGKEKAESLDLMVKSLDVFLDKSYPLESSTQDKFKALYQFMSESSNIDSNWVFDTEFNREILERFEKSGMRSEIYLYPVENYKSEFFIDKKHFETGQDSTKELGKLILEFEADSLVPAGGVYSLELIQCEIEAKQIEAELKRRSDSNLCFNDKGQFLYGLSKFGGNDTLINNYVQLRLAFPSFHPFTFIEINFNKGIKYENPFFKRIVIADIYYLMIKGDIERKTTR